jgi:hypothetical protein
MLAPGVMLNLDFVLLPHAPVPDGVWALGPELPRRVPLMVPLAWLDPVIGSVAAGKLLALGSLAGSFVGATRLVPRSVGQPWRYAAGILYAFGGFATTRLAVGHLFVLAAMAVLPFAAPHLLRPTRDLRRTFLWALGLALTGSFGGSLALLFVAVGALGAGRRGIAALATAAAAQAPWAVPGVLVGRGNYDLAPARAFRPDVDGLLELLAVPAGSGFWQDAYQVGWAPAVGAVLGASVVVLASAGRNQLDRLPRLGPVAVVALLAVLATSVEAFDPVTGPLFGLPGLVSVRETHRLLAVFLLWAAPAAAAGAERLADRARASQAPFLRPAALVVALVVAAPGMWGAGGQLRSTPLPSEWDRARAAVRDDPGTVLALPFFQYLDLDIADGRRVLNPLPLWFGGDVLNASDPRLPGGRAKEQDDPRAETAAQLIAANVGGAAVAPGLARLGVRWVAVAAGGGVLRGRSIGDLHVEALDEDPGLDHVVDGASIDLYEVTGWQGPVRTADGRVLEPDFVVGPFATLEASGSATWFRPGASGWLRGATPLSVDDLGRLRLPPGAGPLWYWPAVAAALTYLAILVTVVILYGQLRRTRHRIFPAEDDGA